MTSVKNVAICVKLKSKKTIPQILIIIIKRKNNDNFTTKNNFKLMKKINYCMV